MPSRLVARLLGQAIAAEQERHAAGVQGLRFDVRTEPKTIFLPWTLIAGGALCAGGLVPLALALTRANAWPIFAGQLGLSFVGWGDALLAIFASLTGALGRPL